MKTRYTRLAKLGAVAIAAGLALTGCSSNDQGNDTTSSSSAAASSTEKADAKVTFTDAIVKAKPADKDMTGVFGKLHNTTKDEITITEVSTSLNAPKNEIHEVVDGKMRPKEGGIKIPAGGTYELKPGGDHLMIMDYKNEIKTGDTVKVSAKLSDGSTVELGDVQVRDMGAGNENYGDMANHPSGAPMSGMNMDGMNHDMGNKPEGMHN